MSRKTLARAGLALLIAAVLGSAGVIVVKNNSAMNPSGGAAPSGFVH